MREIQNSRTPYELFFNGDFPHNTKNAVNDDISVASKSSYLEDASRTRKEEEGTTNNGEMSQWSFARGDKKCENMETEVEPSPVGGANDHGEETTNKTDEFNKVANPSELPHESSIVKSKSEQVASQSANGSEQDENGSDPVADECDEATNGSEQDRNGSDPVVDGCDEATNGSEQDRNASDPVVDGCDEATNGSEQDRNGYDPVVDGCDEATNGSEQDRNASDPVVDGCDEATNGSDPAADGCDEDTNGSDCVADGSDQVANGSKQVTTSFVQLEEDMSDEDLQEGVIEHDAIVKEAIIRNNQSTGIASVECQLGSEETKTPSSEAIEKEHLCEELPQGTLPPADRSSDMPQSMASHNYNMDSHESETSSDSDDDVGMVTNAHFLSSSPTLQRAKLLDSANFTHNEAYDNSGFQAESKMMLGEDLCNTLIDV